MQEIFKNVREEVKETAALAWKIAIGQHDPIAAAKFLDNVINYYTNYYTNEEVEFLQFYFHLQMEMMNK